MINIPLYAGLLTGTDNHTVIKARERFLERRAREREIRERYAAGQDMAEILEQQEAHRAHQQDAEVEGYTPQAENRAITSSGV